MLNNVVLIGRLVKDIEIRHTQNGKAVTQFTVAVQESRDDTQFIDCVAWDKTAENMGAYLHKGSLIAVNGRLQKRSYDDTTGRKVYVTEVVCNRVVFLESRGSSQDVSKASTEPDYNSEDISITDDDLPF